MINEKQALLSKENLFKLIYLRSIIEVLLC